MTPVFGCETARELIDAFVDGELTMPQQVAMQRHIRSCRTCSAHVDDMSLISWSMKTGTPRTHVVDENAGALAVLQSDVLARVRAERALSWRTRLSEMFSDMRLVWPALGASVAVIICLMGTSTIWRLTTLRHPESIPAMLERNVNRGSEDNPVRMDDAASPPVILNEGLAFDGLAGSQPDREFFVDALFTRRGAVEARLLSPSPDVQSAPGRNDGADVLSFIEQWQSRPGKSRGGRPLAVRTLIYFSTTTVTAALRGESFERARRIGRPKDASVPSGTRSLVEHGSAAA